MVGLARTALRQIRIALLLEAAPKISNYQTAVFVGVGENASFIIGIVLVHIVFVTLHDILKPLDFVPQIGRVFRAPG